MCVRDENCEGEGKGGFVSQRAYHLVKSFSHFCSIAFFEQHETGEEKKTIRPYIESPLNSIKLSGHVEHGSYAVLQSCTQWEVPLSDKGRRAPSLSVTGEERRNWQISSDIWPLFFPRAEEAKRKLAVQATVGGAA